MQIQQFLINSFVFTLAENNQISLEHVNFKNTTKEMLHQLYFNNVQG